MAWWMARSLLIVLMHSTLTACETSGAAKEAAVVDVGGMQRLLTEYDKVVLLLHIRSCERAEQFGPTLELIATRLPQLSVGRIDVTRDPSSAWKAAFAQGMPVDSASGIMLNQPTLKAFFRQAPAGQRVHTYRGHSSREVTLAWAKAVDAWPPGGDFADLSAWLEAAVAKATAAEEQDVAGGGGGVAEHPPRGAGREGAFNGRSLGESAYAETMGGPTVLGEGKQPPTGHGPQPAPAANGARQANVRAPAADADNTPLVDARLGAAAYANMMGAPAPMRAEQRAANTVQPTAPSKDEV